MKRYFGGPSGISIPFTSKAAMTTHKMVSHSYASGTSDWNLTDDESHGTYYVVTLAGGGVNMNFPSAWPGKLCAIYNNSGQAVQILVTGKTGFSIANGKKLLFTFNATDTVKLSAEL